ncbi:MAG: hypothetical protein ACE37H_01770 [Phycisphaeraceae bacterium]
MEQACGLTAGKMPAPPNISHFKLTHYPPARRVLPPAARLLQCDAGPSRPDLAGEVAERLKATVC